MPKPDFFYCYASFILCFSNSFLQFSHFQLHATGINYTDQNCVCQNSFTGAKPTQLAWKHIKTLCNLRFCHMIFSMTEEWRTTTLYTFLYNHTRNKIPISISEPQHATWGLAHFTRSYENHQTLKWGLWWLQTLSWELPGWPQTSAAALQCACFLFQTPIFLKCLAQFTSFFCYCAVMKASEANEFKFLWKWLPVQSAAGGGHRNLRLLLICSNSSY